MEKAQTSKLMTAGCKNCGFHEVWNGNPENLDGRTAVKKFVGVVSVPAVRFAPKEPALPRLRVIVGPP